MIDDFIVMLSSEQAVKATPVVGTDFRRIKKKEINHAVKAAEALKKKKNP